MRNRKKEKDNPAYLAYLPLAYLPDPLPFAYLSDPLPFIVKKAKEPLPPRLSSHPSR